MSKINSNKLLNVLKKFKIKKGSNIYVGVEIIMLAKLLKYKSKNLYKLADFILKFLVDIVGKTGNVVIPVFNLDCVPKKKI